MIRLLKWISVAVVILFIIGLFLPEGSAGSDFTIGVLSFLIIILLVLSAMALMRWLVGRLRGASTAVLGGEAIKESETEARATSEYFLQRRDWEGDEGISAKQYDILRRGEKKALFRNNLRPQGKSWRSTFFQIKVAGVSHRQDELQRPEFDLGSLVSLVPDPDNPHSPSGKAVAIWDARRHYQVGFVPEGDAPLVFHRLMTADHVWGFVQTEYWREGKRVGLELLLVPPEKDLAFPPEGRSSE